REEDALLQDAGLHPRVAYGSEVDRLVPREVFEGILADELSSLQVVVCSEGERRPFYLKAVLLCRGLRHLLPLGHDLGADPIARYNGNFVLLADLTILLVYSTSPPEPTISWRKGGRGVVR